MQYFDFKLPADDYAHDTAKWLVDGQNTINNEANRTSTGVRGGSVGAIINNEFYGVCPRKAYLRLNNIETPLGIEIELMTKQGEKNEEIWLAELERGLPDYLYVLDQTQFDCSWKFSVDGKEFTGTGSPDLVVFSKSNDKPVLGYELKNISSSSTMKSAHYELKPKTDHLIQAANYSLRMGDQYGLGKPLPYQLVYSSRSIWQVYTLPVKVKEMIVKCGWDLDWKYGKPMSVKPFHRIYYLDWSLDGCLKYWTHGMKAWVQTDINRSSIDHYYEVVAAGIDKENWLGPRPSAKHVDGSSSYSPCEYCDFKPVCDSHERLSVQEFKDHAQVFAAAAWKERKTT